MGGVQHRPFYMYLEGLSCTHGCSGSLLCVRYDIPGGRCQQVKLTSVNAIHTHWLGTNTYPSHRGAGLHTDLRQGTRPHDHVVWECTTTSPSRAKAYMEDDDTTVSYGRCSRGLMLQSLSQPRCTYLLCWTSEQGRSIKAPSLNKVGYLCRRKGCQAAADIKEHQKRSVSATNRA